MIYAKHMTLIWGSKNGEEVIYKVLLEETDKPTFRFLCGSRLFNYYKLRWFDCVNDKWRVTDAFPFFDAFVIDLATGNVDIDIRFDKRAGMYKELGQNEKEI